MTDIVWPPDYTLKRHARARNVKLKASPQKGFEIILPKRFSVKHLPQILEENRDWIEKRLHEIQNVIEPTLPETINLHALNQSWRVFYTKTSHKKLQLMARPHGEIVLVGNIENRQACIQLLSAWIREQAQFYLVTLLKTLSAEMNLPFERVTIRGQTTRWGSCTSKKFISLNYKLMFLPNELVRHILIHELCHTIYLNHSTRFWRLVAKFDSEWKESSRKVRRGDQWVPRWIE